MDVAAAATDEGVARFPDVGPPTKPGVAYVV